MAANLLNSMANPYNYPLLNKTTGNQVNGQNLGPGVTYTIQILEIETWDRTTLTDTVENFTYFVPGSPAEQPQPVKQEKDASWKPASPDLSST